MRTLLQACKSGTFSKTQAAVADSIADGWPVRTAIGGRCLQILNPSQPPLPTVKLNYLALFGVADACKPSTPLNHHPCLPYTSTTWPSAAWQRLAKSVAWQMLPQNCGRIDWLANCICRGLRGIGEEENTWP